MTEDDYPPVADDGDAPSPPRAATAAPQVLSGSTDNPDAVPPAPQSVEVGTLGTTEGPPAGLLDSPNGGLGESLWSGSKRAAVVDLLSRIPLATPDPAIRALAKRIVLTKAAAPFGQSKRALVTLRIEKLLDAGLIDEAGALAAQASVPDDADFMRVQADALLTANRAADVCGNLTATRLTAGELFWLQLRTYCAAAGGDEATAELTHEVLEAQGNSDKAFDTLADDALTHKNTPPGPIAHPTAMHLFLFQQAGLPIPGDVAAAMGTAANVLAVRDARDTAQTRFAAAERIVRTGAVSAVELRKLSDAQDIPLTHVANALTEAQSAPFFAGQVLLHRAAQIEPRPDAKVQLVAEALSLGDRAGLLPLAAGLQSDIVASIKPTAANRAVADLFARALLLAGRPDVAARWTNSSDVLRTVVDLAAPDPSRDAQAQAAYSAFATALVKNPPDADPEKPAKALVLGVADVLGRPLPPDAKAQSQGIEATRWDGKRPDPDTMRRIEAASLHPGRRG
ncbi:MAG: hypothetical protein KGM97_02975, partial [Alphaproteobacteria bacterium]|nr:hypothetical protein [Alphaproteobacteria bacterium]